MALFGIFKLIALAFILKSLFLLPYLNVNNSILLLSYFTKGGLFLNVKTNIASCLTNFKDKNKMSLINLAEFLEISRSTLQKYLKGTGNPSIDILQHMADKMNMDILQLICGPASLIGCKEFKNISAVINIFYSLPMSHREFIIQHISLIRSILNLNDDNSK